MMNFKRCSTAVALLMATALPAFADEHMTTRVVTVPADFVVTEDQVVLQFAGDEALYVVSKATAAELCGLSDADFESVVDGTNVTVIYCENVDTVLLAERQAEMMPLTDFEDADDDDDDGDFGDDAEETALDEAADEDNEDPLDDLTEDDDVEAPADDTDGTGDSDSVEGEDVTTGQ